MNPFRLVAHAQAEVRRRELVYQQVLAARPLDLAALWNARRAADRADL